MKKDNNEELFFLPDTKTYYKTTVITTIWCGNRQVNQNKYPDRGLRCMET